MTRDDQTRLVLAMLDVLPIDGSLTKQDVIDCMVTAVMSVCYSAKLTPSEFAILLLAESTQFDQVATVLRDSDR